VKDPLKHKKYLIVFSLALVGFAILLISIMLKGLIANLFIQADNTLYTQFLVLEERLKEKADVAYSELVLVVIDDRTLNKLGAYNPSEYRRYQVDALANIVAGHPKAVVYDVLFTDLHNDPTVDERLAHTIKQGRVFSVISASERDASGGMFENDRYLIPTPPQAKPIERGGFQPMVPSIKAALAGVGVANVYPDNDGVLRKIPLFIEIGSGLYPTIALEAFRQIKGYPREDVVVSNTAVRLGDLKIPVDKYCRVYIHIQEATHRIREISFYDVRGGRIPSAFFRDKIVFVAATATGLGDMKLIPLYGYIPGVKIHANLLLGLLNKDFICEVAGKRYYILLFFVALFYTYLFYTKRELFLLRRLWDYISTVGIVSRIFDTLSKIKALGWLYEKARGVYRSSYGIRFFFILFRGTRKRLEPLLIHFMILYVLIFLIYYHFHIFVKPSAVLIQLLIVYIVVYEFRRIDFSELTQSYYQ
jgi:adenylate cyclase